MCPAVSAVKWQKVSSSIVACACAMSALRSNACLQQDIDTSGMQFAVSGLQQSGSKVPLLGQEAFLALHSCQKVPSMENFQVHVLCLLCRCWTRTRINTSHSTSLQGGGQHVKPQRELQQQRRQQRCKELCRFDQSGWRVEAGDIYMPQQPRRRQMFKKV